MYNYQFMNEIGKQMMNLRTWLRIREELGDSRDYVEFTYSGKPYKISYIPDVGHYLLNDKQLVIETRRITETATERYKIFNNYKELEDYVEHAEGRVAKTVRSYLH